MSMCASVYIFFFNNTKQMFALLYILRPSDEKMQRKKLLNTSFKV